VFGMTDTSGNPDLMIAAALKRSGASVSAQRAILAKAEKRFTKPGKGAWLKLPLDTGTA
jgi:hypothetical protein